MTAQVSTGGVIVSPSDNFQAVVSGPAGTVVTSSSDVAWLSAGPANGSIGSFGATFTVFTNAYAIVNLANATYTGHINFSVGGFTMATVTVTLAVNGGSGTIPGGGTPGVTGTVTASPASLSFSASSPISTVPTQTVKILSNTGAPIQFLALAGTSGGGNWLTISPNRGTAGVDDSSAAVLTVEVDPGSLKANQQQYTGQIAIYGAGTSSIPLLQTIAVTLNMGSTGGGYFSTNPSSLTFSSVGGQTPASQTVSVGGNGSFYVSQPTVSWISVQAYSFVAPTTLTVQVNPAGLASQTYQTQIVLNTSGTGQTGQTIIPVTFNVSSSPVSSISPTVLNFAYTPGFSLPATQYINVSSTTYTTYTASVNTGASWLSVNPLTGYSPGTLSVSVSPASLAVGTYSGVISVSMGDGSGAQYIAVNLVVGNGGAITVSQDTVNITGFPGSGSTSTTVTVNSTTGLTVPFTASTSSSTGWLQASSTGMAPGSVTITANPGYLNVGTYSGVVTLTPSTGGSRSISVILTVGASGNITVTPTSLAFSAQSGGSNPATQQLTITAPAAVYYNASASSTPTSWLSVYPNYGTAGTSATPLTVSVNQANLAAGTYYGTITISATGATTSAATVYVTLTVSSAGVLTVSPASLTFNYGGGTTPAAQSISLSGSMTGLGYTAQVIQGSWLSVSPTAGASLPASLQVSVNPSGLTPNTYTGSISLTPVGTGAGASQTVTVTLTVTAPPATVSASPTSLSFTFDGANQPSAQTISVSGTGTPGNFSATASGGFLSVSPGSGAIPGSLTVSVTPQGMQAGTYNGSVTVTANATGSPINIPVTLTVQNILPVFSSVINGASLTAGVATGGTIITIFGQRLGPARGVGYYFDSAGRLSTQLDETRVLVNGAATSLLYVSEKQVNAILPMGAGAAGTVEIMVQYRGLSSAPVRMQLAEAAPALFTADASGSGLAAALNQDGSVNSNAEPAAAGSVVSLFGTGGGQFDLPLRDGEVVPSQPLARVIMTPSATIGGRDAQVIFAGAAPGQITGVVQVNVQIPAGLAPGRYPVFVKIGRYSSQLGVTIAVK